MRHRGPPGVLAASRGRSACRGGLGLGRLRWASARAQRVNNDVANGSAAKLPGWLAVRDSPAAPPAAPRPALAARPRPRAHAALCCCLHAPPGAHAPCNACVTSGRAVKGSAGCCSKQVKVWKRCWVAKLRERIEGSRQAEARFERGAGQRKFEEGIGGCVPLESQCTVQSPAAGALPHELHVPGAHCDYTRVPALCAHARHGFALTIQYHMISRSRQRV